MSSLPLYLLLLDELENREKATLQWGYVDGSFTKSEVIEIAERLAEEHQTEQIPRAAISELLNRAMLIAVPYVDGRYRTRMAETVRLAFHLRQIMPSMSWQQGLSLVSDYRFDFAARRRPVREHTSDTVVQEMEVTGLSAKAVKALIGDKLISGFQLKAARTIWASKGKEKAVIVTAGTGAGKTMAFYLPCFTIIAEKLTKADLWTQAVAIYPRVVLLADQFSTAYKEARLLDGTLKAERPISIGAYFGQTPSDFSDLSLSKAKWRGSVCPFFACPKCGGEMAWLEQDRKKELEVLSCKEHGCSGKTGDGELRLTRKSIKNRPPDVLFTTTEMVHRELAQKETRAVFIGKGRKRPHILLLDEAHTYYSTHGAQVALVLRRWRHAVASNVLYVGLSATLGDPAGFFALLVGLSPTKVDHVDMEDDVSLEGREYRLVLRANPVSGTSVLSTSIQAAMLFGRVLDPLKVKKSQGMFPPKLFVFTDDLDVHTRLFHDLLDAEGRKWDGSVVKPALGEKRDPNDANEQNQSAKYAAGQDWTVSFKAGHIMSGPGASLSIGRISSKDPGVDVQKKVIVATASLEVGYDDPDVGAVLQHKAPRGAASFLQRKGRGGRKSEARPWTVVVLSDFGRDRIAFQAWEHIFEPQNKRPPLPVNNRYVLKMQAAAALMDWLALRVEAKYLRNDLAGVSDPPYRDPQLSLHSKVSRIIKSVLENEEVRKQLADHLKESLKIRPDEVTAILWESPRAIMTAVLPTLLRRLETQWTFVESREAINKEGSKPRRPLWEFVSDNLFSDLNVPELKVSYQELTGKDDGEDVFPILQGMNETAPGRVSRRFSINAMKKSHWIAPPDALNGPYSDRPMPIDKYCVPGEYTEEGFATFSAMSGVKTIRMVRPLAMRETYVPENVKPSSNAKHEWHSQILSPHDGQEAEDPSGRFSPNIISKIVFHTVNNGAPVLAKRFSIGTHVRQREKPSGELNYRIRFVDETLENPICVGFSQEVDGVVFKLHMSDSVVERAKTGPAHKSLRQGFFRVEVAKALSELRETTDHRIDVDFFNYDWIADTLMAALTIWSSTHGKGFDDAIAHFEAKSDWGGELRPAVTALFQIDSTDDQVDPDSDTQEPTGIDDLKGPKRFQAVRTAFREPEVKRALISASKNLVNPEGGRFDKYVRTVLKDTVAGALLQACINLITDCDPEDLIVDTDPGPNDDGTQRNDEIWICEKVLGGAGIIERLEEAYSHDPRRFFLLVELALHPGDLELADIGLTQFLKLVAGTDPDEELRGAVQVLRDSSTQVEVTKNYRLLRTALKKKRLPPHHTFLVALNARLLRSGTSSVTDSLAFGLLQEWDRLEEDLGIEIDARVYTVIAASGPHEKAIVKLLRSSGFQNPSVSEKCSVVSSLLWLRGLNVRKSSIDFYNPFQTQSPLVDPLILRTLGVQEVSVDVTNPNWNGKARELLVSRGSVKLTAPPFRECKLSDAILEMIVEPTDTGFLRIYPTLVHAESGPGGSSVVLHLKESY
jgi:hypothetical protein